MDYHGAFDHMMETVGDYDDYLEQMVKEYPEDLWQVIFNAYNDLPDSDDFCIATRKVLEKMYEDRIAA